MRKTIHLCAVISLLLQEATLTAQAPAPDHDFYLSDHRLPVTVCAEGLWRYQGDLIIYSYACMLMLRNADRDVHLAREHYLGFRVEDRAQQAVDLNPEAFWIRLRNRDLWRVESVRINEDEIHIHQPILGEWSWPLSDVASLAIGEPGSLRYTERGDEFKAKLAAEWDRVRLGDGQVVEGMIGFLDAEHVQLEGKAASLRLPLSRIGMIDFADRGHEGDALANDRRHQPQQVMVDLVDGTRVSFRAMNYLYDGASAGTFEAQYDARRKVRFDGSRVRAVWHRDNSWTWLGDLKPVSLEGSSMLGEVWPVVRDRTVMGDPMIVGGRVFTRGLGMHATSRATWKVEGPFNRLRGAVALDDSAKPYGRVDVRILVNGEPRFALDDLKAGKTPVDFDVALSEGATLELFAEAEAEGEIQDRVNWLDMFLVNVPSAAATQAP